MYNDIDIPYNQEIYSRLVNHGMHRAFPLDSSSQLFKGIDELLSKHIAHIFIRDPLAILPESLDQDDETSNGHFEVSNVHSSGH